MSHLLVAISHHGFGHLAQVAPIIQRVRERLPGLRLTLRTTLPRALLAQRIGGEFSVQPVADDFGMLQHGALEVDLPASLERYQRLHAGWPQEVERVARELAAVSPDLLFADVPYLTLAAAHHAGIASLAMCSLNWHAILQGYLSHDDEATPILATIQRAYASAGSFLRPEPSMPMPGLGNLHDIGVVARTGHNRRKELECGGQLGTRERLVLIAMGGIDHRLPLERWPVTPGLRYIVPAAWQVSRSDCLTIEGCGMDFSDLLASVDAMITKPGYGAFAEAAINGLAVLYVRRVDWPEEPALVEWLQKNANCREIARDALEQGRVSEQLQRLFAARRVAPVRASGVEEAASIIVSRLAATERT